ncbi:MAG: response regulator [Bacteroidota bacterium]
METTSNVTPFNILIAEDDDDYIFLFARALNHCRPESVLMRAVNGLEVLTILKDESVVLPDLIFLDLNMPLMSGHQCLKEIRNNSLYKEIPIVIYSTSPDEEDMESTFNEGADLYIVKSSNTKQNIKVLEKIFCNNMEIFNNRKKENYIYFADRL